MKSHSGIIIAIFCLLSTYSYSQNANMARAYYIKAKEAFANNQYSEVIDYLGKAETELGTTNADIIYLELMSRFNMNKRDFRIEKLSKDFMASANSRDDRIQKVGLIAVEHKELLEADRKKEQRAFDLAKRTKSLKNLRAYLKDYPNTSKSSEVKILLSEKETEDFNKAKNKNSVFALENFKKDYPDGEFDSEVSNLLKIAREEELYRKAKNQNSIQLYKSYLISYPQGQYISQVKESLRSELLEKANNEYENEDLNLAKDTYQEFNRHFPSGSDAAFVTERIIDIEKKMTKQARVNSRTSGNYFMATYSTDELYGIQFGKLSLNRVGTYFNLSVNENIANIQFESVNETTLPAENFEQASISAGFGLTYKIIYPLWIYAGGGAIYTDYYEEIGDGEVVTYAIDSLENYQFFPEFGVNIKLGRIAAIKAGAALINGETYIKAGVGFQTRNW